MKTIPKRADLYTNPTEKNSNIKQQISQFLEAKDTLSQKLKILTKLISNQVNNFVNKNQPISITEINLLNFEKNIFGTQRTFQQFSTNYKQISASIQFDVQSVVQVLQKFSFTKNLSLFINNGLVPAFLKIHELMLKREQFCTKLFFQVERQALKGKGSIFCKQSPQITHCVKCYSHIQKQKLRDLNQNILLGGHRINQFYKKNLQLGKQDKDQKDPNIYPNPYEKIHQIKKKLNKSSDFSLQIISEEDIKFNLSKLQSNLEQRKFDIMACLAQMGQFGLQIKNSGQNLEKILIQKERTPPNFAQTLAQHLVQKFSLIPKNNIPPRFNYKDFTFNISKHFYKQIRQIQNELQQIKKRFGSILFTQSERLISSQTQCNLIKDSYDKQMEKYKRKNDRQIVNRDALIKQISQLNKNLKEKVDQYQKVVKVYISSKLGEEPDELQKIKIQMRIPRLIDRYELKLKEQQKQLKILRQKTLNYRKSQQFKRESKQSNVFDQNCASLPSNYKQNIQKVFDTKLRKKKALYFQAIVKKISQKNNKQNQGKQEKQTQNQKSNNKLKENQPDVNEMIEQLLNDNSLNSIETSRKCFEKSQNLQIISKVIQFQVLQLNRKNFKIVNEFSKKIIKFQTNKSIEDKCIQIGQKQLLSDQVEQQTYKDDRIKKDLIRYKNDMIKQDGEKSQAKLKRKAKLLKTKSQADSKTYPLDGQEQQKSQINNRKQVQYSNQTLKRYASEHSTNLQKKVNFQMKRDKFQKKKLTKAISVTFEKKASQESNAKSLISSVKLPSISHHQATKGEKLKQLQKSLNNKNNLLTKKKRKKRNFSQQTLMRGSMLDNNQMAKSSGNRMQMMNFKQKNKKQYIIDFIPQVQQQEIQKNHNFDSHIGQVEIEALFENLTQNKGVDRNQRKYKSKYLTKVIHLKRSMSDQAIVTLKKSQISLSTKIYSILAAIKSLNIDLYKKIRQKLRNQYDRRNKQVKNNCDQLSMALTLSDEQTQIDHFPLSLTINHDHLQADDISSNVQKLKEKSYQRGKQNNQGNQQINQRIKSNQNPSVYKCNQQQAEIREIINFVIIKHRNLCNHSQQNESKLKQNIKMCEHILSFIRFLTDIKQKIKPSQ